MKIEIPNFARDICVSKARRAKFYKHGDKIPKKYQTKSYNFIPYRGKMVLVETSTNQPVIKNPTQAGTPSFVTIAGNDVWDTHRRGDYVEKIKLSIQVYFWEIIKHFKLDKEDLESLIPIRITFDFYTCKETQDLDNLELLYKKAFIDAIQDKKYPVEEKRLIRNDTTKWIKSLYTNHHDVKTKDNEKLVITLTKCDNIVIDYANDITTLNINNLKNEQTN